MDRLSHLRDEAGGSRDSSLDSSVSPAFLTANEDSSKYFSLSEIDTSAENETSKDATLTLDTANSDSAAPDSTRAEICGLTNDFNIQNQIDAANILSGGVNIFDDHDNSPDGNNLVIDDNVELDMIDEEEIIDNVQETNVETEQNIPKTPSKPEPTLTTANSPKLLTESVFENKIMVPDSIPSVTDQIVDQPNKESSQKCVETSSQDSKVVLLIDGNYMNAIDIGNGLYLFRRENDREEDLGAVQILDKEGPQLRFKFLKVRENSEGSLVLYEDIIEEEETDAKEDTVTPEKSTDVISSESNKVQSEMEIKSKNVAEVTQNEKPAEKETAPENDVEKNETSKVLKFGSEARKSPLVGSFTPMTFHSTPNKEGVPLTKTMVDLQLHPNKHPDMAKKTIELTTDGSKSKPNATDNLKQDKITENTLSDKNKPLVEQMEGNLQNINVPNSKVANSTSDLPCNDIVSNKDTIKVDDKKSNDVTTKNTPIAEKSDIFNIEKSIQNNKISESNKLETEKSTINNNKVPFGKWTLADRKEFINKMNKDSKTNVVPNPNQIKKPNDLNRRDFLKKIDIARQNLNVLKKDAANANTSKSSLSTVPSQQPKAFQSHIPETRFEANFNIDTFSPNEVPKDTAKDNRTEMNNQDLIDKTIMDIMDKVPSKPQHIESNIKAPKSFLAKPAATTNASVSDNLINQKPDYSSANTNQNKLFSCEEKGAKSTSFKDTSLLKDTINSEKTPITKPTFSNEISQHNKQIDDNHRDEDLSEEEILEHEPVTGDSLPQGYLSSNTNIKKNILSKHSNKVNNFPTENNYITEKEFDKFARRNSVTLENQLTLTVDKNTEPHYSKSSITKPIQTSQDYYKRSGTHNIHVKHNPFNKEHDKKVQDAYQSLTAARPNESVLAPFDVQDKKVQVVYVDHTNEFIPYNLNVQGPQLATSNKPEFKDSESTLSSTDSMDLDFVDNVDCSKNAPLEDTKVKIKHPRKQVLTSVETPDLELIEPTDLGMEIVSKRKKKMDEYQKKNQEDKKYSKSLLPKKTYLLSRNPREDLSTTPKVEETKIKNCNISDYSKDLSSNIDSLVKAAELIENQPDVVKTLVALKSNAPTMPSVSAKKRGRGRPRKYPLTDDSRSESISPSSQKKTKLSDNNSTTSEITTAQSDQSGDDSDLDNETKIRENWTMGKINENILCPICNKLFRSEEVVYKHVQHCSKASLNAKSHCSMRRSSRNFDVKDLDMNRGTLNRFNKPLKEIKEKKEDTGDHVSQKKEQPELERIPCNTEHSKNEIKDVIIIEDTPRKPQKPAPPTKDVSEITHSVPTKSTKKPTHPIANYECKICGKTFRQMSYLLNHKLLHKTETKTRTKTVSNELDSKSVFTCESCSKTFRKLHHLVQHRMIHNQSSARPKRRSTEESDKKPSRPSAVTTNVDVASAGKSAGFRCERCDKSFRKLHHLVEHRETHDGASKTRTVIAQKVDTEKEKSAENDKNVPQCPVCKKTFRKLHHLSEHKETHLNEKRGPANDIIHECPMCYMVFPNDYALEKHIVACKRKRRQAAAKRSSSKAAPQTISEREDDDADDVPVARLRPATAEDNARKPTDVQEVAPRTTSKVDDGRQKRHDRKSTSSKRNSEEVDREKLTKIPVKVAKTEETVTSEKREAEKTETKVDDTRAKKRRLTREPSPPVIHIESEGESESESEARYMINPKFEDVFHKVRANKRSSLQIVRPKADGTVRAGRRVSLQQGPRPRARAPAVTPALAPVRADEAEVKYAFPPEPVRPVPGPGRRRTVAGPGTDGNKSPIRTAAIVAKPKKKSVEYRCDCGSVFAAATLLARHTTIAHTPPRRARHPQNSQNPDTNRAKATKIQDKTKRTSKT